MRASEKGSHPRLAISVTRQLGARSRREPRLGPGRRAVPRHDAMSGRSERADQSGSHFTRTQYGDGLFHALLPQLVSNLTYPRSLVRFDEGSHRRLGNHEYGTCAAPDSSPDIIHESHQ